MGTTYRTGTGYGILIPVEEAQKRLPKAFAEELEEEAMSLFDLEDKFETPLLQFDTAGNAWADYSFFIITTTSTTSSDYDFFVECGEKHHSTEEELAELERVLAILNLSDCKKSWWSWSYQG